MTFSDRLNILISQKKITGMDLAQSVGVSNASVTGWRHGSYPTADVACKIANYFNVSVEYLINGSTAPTIQDKNAFYIPVLSQSLSAGKGTLLSEVDEEVGYIPCPKNLYHLKNHLYALTVNGDSMQPTLNDGDMILCDDLGFENTDGLYALRFNGNGFVKRIQVTNDKILIISDNQKYKVIEEPLGSQNIDIIGKVHYAFSHII